MSKQELFHNERNITAERPLNKSLRIDFEDDRLQVIMNECCNLLKEDGNIFERKTQEKFERKLIERNVLNECLEVFDENIWDLPEEIPQTFFYIRMVKTPSGEIIAPRGEKIFINNKEDYFDFKNKYYGDLPSLELKTLKISSLIDNFSIIFIEKKIDCRRFNLF